MKPSTAAVTVGLVVVTAIAAPSGGSRSRSDDGRLREPSARGTISAPLEASGQQAPPKVPKNPAPPAPGGHAVNPIGAATKVFLDQVKAYLDYHNKVEQMVPQLTETSDPAKVSAREKALGEMLIKHRPNARHGDIFVKDYQPILQKIIKDDFAKRSLADRKALIVELPKGVKIGVNMVYPTTLPLATFPAQLLKQLPELPPELEYRIVGRDLILRDVKGNVVVDIMPSVIPIPV